MKDFLIIIIILMVMILLFYMYYRKLGKVSFKYMADEVETIEALEGSVTKMFNTYL